MVAKLLTSLTMAILAAIYIIPGSVGQNMCDCNLPNNCPYFAWSAACSTNADCVNSGYVTGNPVCIRGICCTPLKCADGSPTSLGNCLLQQTDRDAMCRERNPAAVCHRSPSFYGTATNIAETVGACCAPKTCQKSTGQDISGSDISILIGYENDCCQYCANTPNCKAYAWTTSTSGTCFLKNNVGPVITNPGVKLGIMSASRTCSKQDGHDMVGNDMRLAVALQESDCCNLCTADPSCKAYVWATKTSGTCFLKSASGPVFSNPIVNLGILQS